MTGLPKIKSRGAILLEIEYRGTREVKIWGQRFAVRGAGLDTHQEAGAKLENITGFLSCGTCPLLP